MSQSSKLRSSFLTTDRGFKPALCTNWMKLGLGMFIILTVSVNWCQSENRYECLGENKPCQHELVWSSKENCPSFFKAYKCRMTNLATSNCSSDDAVFELALKNVTKVFSKTEQHAGVALQCVQRKAATNVLHVISMTNSYPYCHDMLEKECSAFTGPTTNATYQECHVLKHSMLCTAAVTDNSDCMNRTRVTERVKDTAERVLLESDNIEKVYILETKLRARMIPDRDCTHVLDDESREVMRYFGTRSGEETKDRSTSLAVPRVDPWWGVLAPLGLASLLLREI